MNRTLLSSLFAIGLIAPVYAQDADAGKRAFAQCRACHSIINSDDEVIYRGGRTGPNLWGLPGRVAGTQEDFPRYQRALIAAGENGLIWDEEQFVAFVQDPLDFVRVYLDDNRARAGMVFRVRDEQTARDIWAYIESVSPEMEGQESDGVDPETAQGVSE